MKAQFIPNPNSEPPQSLSRDEAMNQIGIFKRIQAGPNDFTSMGPQYLIGAGVSDVCIYITPEGGFNVFKTTIDRSYRECRFVPVSGTITLVSNAK